MWSLRGDFLQSFASALSLALWWELIEHGVFVTPDQSAETILVSIKGLGTLASGLALLLTPAVLTSQGLATVL